MSVQSERMTAGLSQRELAEKSGVPWRTIQNFEECGIAPRTMNNLRKLKEFFGCSYEDLLD